ncbi:MAG: DUF1302 domain-containing protein [Burkholderiaceae bacterium]|nr:DUF1302 domain-containing protein [Burkholderiaceae bacterium]
MACAAGAFSGAGAQGTANALPGLGEESEPWKVDFYYENDTHARGKDATGSHVGLSKFRNTAQIEADKKFTGGWSFRSILRGTFDGVYRMNDDEYGRKAGGSIMLESTAGGARLPAAYGGLGASSGGLVVDHDTVAGLGLVNNKFLNSADLLARSPNAGLRVLGDRWHPINGGVAFATPVRPCDTDRRGCANFGGYGNSSRSDLESPEFNERLDFIREAYVRNTVQLEDGKSLFLKLGKQQVVWGRTDLFRVLDVINPVDYSRNNIYDELQDIRIPMWIAQAEYRMGGGDILQERNLQVVWNFDKFRPNNLGQCGTANVILDAGCFFRGMKNLWDNGGTVANFANVGPGTLLATNFGPGQIGLNKVHLPSWSLKNTQLGVKFEGVTKEGVSFSLNALTYRSQLPSLHGGKRAVNGFTGEFRDAWPYLISFDMEFPRVHLIGGSMDFHVESVGAAFRVEAAVTEGEEFANTLKPKLYSKNNVFRSVIGVDRPTFVPFISETRTTLFSGQLFYQHIFDHQLKNGQFGPVGMPDWEDNAIATLLVKAFLMNDRLSPQVIFARDFRAKAMAAAPSLEWLYSDNLKLTVGGNFKLGTTRADKFDDCRACNPWGPFTAPVGDSDPMTAFSRGLGGFEPLGRFRAGPIGAAFKEDEVFVSLRYKF